MRTVTKHVATVSMTKIVTSLMEVVPVIARLDGKEKSVYRVKDLVLTRFSLILLT